MKHRSNFVIVILGGTRVPASVSRPVRALFLQVRVLRIRDEHAAGRVMGERACFATMDWGVTPAPRTRGTSPSRDVHGSPNSGCAMSRTPMARGADGGRAVHLRDGAGDPHRLHSPGRGDGAHRHDHIAGHAAGGRARHAGEYMGTLQPMVLWRISMPASMRLALERERAADDERRGRRASSPRRSPPRPPAGRVRRCGSAGSRWRCRNRWRR